MRPQRTLDPFLHIVRISLITQNRAHLFLESDGTMVLDYNVDSRKGRMLASHKLLDDDLDVETRVF